MKKELTCSDVGLIALALREKAALDLKLQSALTESEIGLRLRLTFADQAKQATELAELFETYPGVVIDVDRWKD